MLYGLSWQVRSIHQLTWVLLRDLGADSKMDYPVCGSSFLGTTSSIVFSILHGHVKVIKPRYMIRGLKDDPRKETGHKPDCLWDFHSAHVRRAHGKQDKWVANCRNCLASRNILKLPFFLGLITADMQHDECAYMLHACISCSNRNRVYIQRSWCIQYR